MSDSMSNTARQTARDPSRFVNPYAGGVGLGIVLFLSIILTGHGLGASGGLSRLLTAFYKVLMPARVADSAFFAPLGGGSLSPLDHWLVWQVVGVMIGGVASGYLAGRFKSEVLRGPAISARWRLFFAFVGGAIAGWGTQMSRGCTSGQALSGGATLAAGSWIFMFCVFGGAYALAWFVRKLWN